MIPKPDNFEAVCERWQGGSITATEAMRELKLTRNIFYKYARECGFMKEAD